MNKHFKETILNTTVFIIIGAMGCTAVGFLIAGYSSSSKPKFVPYMGQQLHCHAPINPRTHITRCELGSVVCYRSDTGLSCIKDGNRDAELLDSQREE